MRRYLLYAAAAFLVGCTTPQSGGLKHNIYEIYQNEDRNCYFIENMDTGDKTSLCSPDGREIELTADDFNNFIIMNKLEQALEKDLGDRPIRRGRIEVIVD